ncbi:MAG: hypothetical protein A3E87_11075 [Gammaproteobacteria bacterium RIFCSPHIGHO2_12_FULL_35_23]|nr:MAG: hypothetical protein A3E87_11075 [Gammaproteobacteria bacterium RIFCSPHIGHO2_12_FULL_35_23]
MSIIKLKYWDKTTSFLHFGLATFVTLQLLTSKLMQHDISHAFLFHKIFGLSAVCVVVLHWFWSLSGDKRNFHHLFPWNKQGLLAIINDLRFALHGQLPQGGEREGLPGFIHGLGFLAVTGMAASGFTIFLFIVFSQPPLWVKSIHSFIATFVWIYWFGHVAMVLLHHLVDRLK